MINVEDIRVVTEYMHKLLPTDYDTLTSEDSAISDLNGAFRSKRADFCANLQSSREEAKAVLQDEQIDETFNLAVKQIDDVKKSLNFDTGSESEHSRRRKQKMPMKLSSSAQGKCNGPKPIKPNHTRSLLLQVVADQSQLNPITFSCRL